MRKIANKHGITYAEVNKIFKSQFEFTKEKIESISEEELANASQEELNKLVFTYLYLGKIHSAESLQKFAKKKKQLKQGRL